MTFQSASRAIALWVLFASVAPRVLRAQDITQVPVETFVLDNGMKFLAVQRPELTTVSAGWVAHVGSSNERPGITGISHFFEHMMFKGSRIIGTTNIERDLQIIDEQEPQNPELLPFLEREIIPTISRRDKFLLRPSPFEKYNLLSVKPRRALASIEPVGSPNTETRPGSGDRN